MSKVVLGKGLDALIPVEAVERRSENLYRTVPLDQIVPNPMQPRRDFNEDSLAQLAESFKANGMIQPLIVRQDGSEYVIIAGERRFRAARLAGFDEAPVILSNEVDGDQMLQLALVENLQREDLNPMETAEAYRVLSQRTGMTQSELASVVGKSRAAVANSMRLLSLPQSIQNMLRQGKLTEGHARAILSLASEEEMLQLALRIETESLSVRAVEGKAAAKKKRRLIPKRKLPALAEVESFLKRLLGTSVRIHPGLKRGRIEIEYYGDDDLDRLIELFRKIQA